MILYSEKFHDKLENQELEEYDDFIMQAREKSSFDESLIYDFIYYLQDTFFPNRANKITIKKSTLLKKILYALDYISIEDMMLLKGYELLQVVNSQNPAAILLLYL